MVNDTTTMEYQLPGAYHYQRRPSDKENNNTVSLPLAIVSSVLFPSEASRQQEKQQELMHKPKGQEYEKEQQESAECNKAEYDHQVNALRRTVAELRRKAEQLEQADVMVKKGIEIVARKRVIAQHKRRRQSEWDWCESHSSSSSDENEDDDDDVGVTRQRRPNKKKPLIFVDDEGGEWEVI
ncbi:hypothetical protein BDA99DRAFT_532350 [Phascolomyces articulosus]|uniref:Uncharacterized protein n=1 Tax=Phascolomyces articulosus TaxID=60185 RepID=A0AAD5KXP3_9FUNG|nr:hypothetical protein BDA99DRAFT_532350 [Phascolomyces articulosus]